MKNLKQNIFSGAIIATSFFFTLGILYIAYGALANLPAKVGTGSGLTANSWNMMVDSLIELDGKITSIKICPTGMIKVADYCIDTTPVVNAAGYDQKVAMTRCLSTGKHLCSWLELKTARIKDGSSLCPGGVGRYSSSDSGGYDTTNLRRMYISLDCSNTSYDYMGRTQLNSDHTGESSLCCLSL